MNFSFAGCGFLGIYHVGVTSCLKQHIPQLLNDIKFSGASAGSIVACCLMCDCCLGECTSFTLRLASKARGHALGPLHPSFDVNRILKDALHEVLPSNAHEICSGRLHISMTRVSDRKGIVVSEFDSKEELIQALLCSAFVPFYSGFIPPSFRGTRYVDGCLSDNIPVLDDKTITVSPFAGESDICPMDTSANFIHVNLANTSMQCTENNLYRLSRALFPPHPEILSDMCKQGFDDCLKFLQKNSLISCTRHMSVRSSIMPVASSPDKSNNSDVQEETHCTHADEDDDEDCHECKRVVQGALIDSLPPSVVNAFQATYDSMNKGITAYVHRHKSLRLMKALTTPWILPADIMINYAIRFLEYLPSLPEDVQLMYRESAKLMEILIAKLYHHHSKYTARFTCQLAITEVNYRRTKEDIAKALPSSSPFQPSPEEPLVRNLNIGFAVDFESKSPNTLRSIQQMEGKMENLDINEIELHSKRPWEKYGVSSRSEDVHDTNIPCQQIFDTFEQCLHVSNEMESVMAYYYRDENNSQCYNFQEIYDIDNIDMNIPSPVESDADSLTWDSLIEGHHDVEMEVDEHVKEVLMLPESNPLAKTTALFH